MNCKDGCRFSELTKVPEDVQRKIQSYAKIYAPEGKYEFFKSRDFIEGANFFQSSIMPSLIAKATDKLEKEIDRVIDVADGNANACNLLAEEIDRLKLKIEQARVNGIKECVDMLKNSNDQRADSPLGTAYWLEHELLGEKK